MYSLEDRQHLGGLPFCPNLQYSLLAKTICFCPFCFVYEEKFLKLSHMWNHSLTVRLFLLPSRLLCSLARGGTCPLGPYRLIAYEFRTYIKGGWVSNTDVIISYIHNFISNFAFYHWNSVKIVLFVEPYPWLHKTRA